ncbi:SHOCT domain-containing protein [Streptacidiphilus sp. P02-A3a]|uniref:SHOCT domain-containing protein n=1 Tax=Streptacidiphilus sp. P02-A3a TaxID=2704468 RepID=UPI0015FACEBF|nr:SHOCT domain-containing protein [Streptacidiphilus sp. P02-A3a]QMU69511.1 SHOCT domain-containing protein [Streptacidiphilus sp. P02-A3a]
MNYPLLDVFWTMLEFFLWIMWFFLLFRVIGDIFRNHESSGWNKALWLVLVLILPFLGVLIYVIVHGGDMGRRSVARAEQQQRAFQDYVRQAAGPSGGGSVDELARLAELKDKGALTEAEYQQAKAKILAA